MAEIAAQSTGPSLKMHPARSEPHQRTELCARVVWSHSNRVLTFCREIPVVLDAALHHPAVLPGTGMDIEFVFSN
jgi:hypothetical protein